jgi:hypothetical protein
MLDDSTVTAAEFVNCWISTGLVMLNELRPIVLSPLPCNKRPRQGVALKRL